MEDAGSLGRKGVGGKEEVSLLCQWLECTELSLGMDEESTKNLGVRIKGRAGTGDSGDLLPNQED